VFVFSESFGRQKSTLEYTLPKILMVNVYRPETRCEAETEGGHTLISQVGNHYMLDVKGPDSRISSRIHSLLGGEEKILTPVLITELSRSFSERHAGAREQFERFMTEHVGWTVYSGYYNLEFGPLNELEPLHAV
jgi:hypothetical protein